MTLRADHVAGAFFILFGILVHAFSGDLPFGQLSMPGSGFMPTLIATLTMLFGLALILGAGDGVPFSEVSWSDGKHALMVTAVTAAAIYFYESAGFLITMVAMILVTLIVVERRNPLRAGAYSLAIVLFTYVCFVYLLKTPLPTGPYGF